MNSERGKWVRANRIEQHMSQPQLAEAVGVSSKTIFRAEQGDPLSSYTIKLLTDYFDMPVPEEKSEEDVHYVMSLQ